MDEGTNVVSLQDWRDARDGAWRPDPPIILYAAEGGQFLVDATNGNQRYRVRRGESHVAAGARIIKMIRARRGRA